MPRVLTLGRDPDEVGAAERQAVACAMRTPVEALKFVRTDAISADDHKFMAESYAPEPVCVLLDTAKQAPVVAASVADGVPHYVFGLDKTDNGGDLGNRLFWLTPGGKFELCRRQVTQLR